MYLKTSLILLLGLGLANSQKLKSNTSSSSIASDLWDCYNDTSIPGILDPKSRSPATLNFFLDVLRTLEDATTGIKDAYYLSSDLIKTFRQDGITWKGSIVGLPFTASYNIKNKLLQRLTLDNSGSLETTGLTKKEKCTIHFLISTMNNATERGDESTVCSRTSRYTSRTRREIELLKSMSDSGTISMCPITFGVVKTSWGAISLGSVMSGIAAGFKPGTSGLGDSLYANTISGDIAESALRNQVKLSIGSSEGWDNSINPKVLYNTGTTGGVTQFTLTNSRIRGALDGFYMGSMVQEIKQTFPDIKISQIIDMYYSSRGLFNNSVKACNRTILETSFISTETLTNETRTILKPFNGNIGAASMSEDDYNQTAKDLVDQFNTYLPQLSDVMCQLSDLPVQKKVVDLLIYIDTKWTFETAESVIVYILDSLDINKYEGNYTLINGNTAQEIVPSTYRLSHLFEYYNDTQHSTTNSFAWTSSIDHVQKSIEARINQNTLGGKGVVALFIPSTTPSDNDKTYINQKKSTISEKFPDLQFFILGKGAQSDYSSILSNPSQDFVTLDELTTNNVETIKTNTKKIIDLIADTPRSIVDSKCGGSSVSFSYFIEQQGLDYYKLHPYYFYNGGSSKKLRIREVNGGAMWACIQQNSKPTNTSSSCVKLMSNETVFDLNVCDSYESCGSIYISVQGLEVKTMCKDCRFPDSVQFQITLEQTGCGRSSTIRIMANLFLMALLVLALKF